MMAKNKKENDIYKWVLLGFLWLAYFLIQGTRQIYNAIIPQIQGDFGVDSASMGMVATVFTFTFGICVPFAGIASDILSRKWTIVSGLFIFSAGIFVSGFMSTIGLLLVTYGLINGMGQSFYYPPASSLLGQLHSENRSTAISLHQTAQYLGIVICSIVAGFLGDLPSEGGVAGWRLPFFLFGAIGIVWAVVLTIFMRDTKHAPHVGIVEEKATFKSAFSVMFKRPSALILSLSFGFMVYVDVGFKTWMPTYLFDTFKMDLAHAAFNATIWHYVGAFIGVMAGSRIVDKLVARKITTARFDANVLGFLCGAPFIYLMANSSDFYLCAFAMFAFGICRGVADAGIFASLFDVVPVRYRASCMGIMLCVGFVIGSTSSTVLGWMRDNFGLGSGIVTLSALYIINAIIIFVARRIFFHKDYVSD